MVPVRVRVKDYHPAGTWEASQVSADLIHGCRTEMGITEDVKPGTGDQID